MSMSSRFRLLRGLLGSIAAILMLQPPALAQPQPGKTVRLLVGFPAGGGTDAIARLLADRLKDVLNAPVVVDNRPGAGGQIAAQALKSAPPDGTTLFVSHDHTITILPLTMKNPGFDPARDFVPVAGFGTFVNGLALSGATPARDFKGFIEWIGRQGGKSAIGIPAPASVPEFLVRRIGETYRLDLAAAPYRGSAPMIGDMLGNQIPAGVGSTADFMEHHRAGKLRIVAVMGTARQPTLPDVPTFAELGLSGFDEVPYYGIFAPAGTPREVVEQLGAALAKVIAQPEVRERLAGWGLNVMYMSSEELAARERAYGRAMAEVIRRSGFQPQ